MPAQYYGTLKEIAKLRLIKAGFHPKNIQLHRMETQDVFDISFEESGKTITVHGISVNTNPKAIMDEVMEKIKQGNYWSKKL